jgi:hypothetical protein
MNDVRAGMAARETRDYNMWLKGEAAQKGDDRAQLSAWTAAREAQQEMDSDFDSAIRRTQDAYRLAPELPDGSRVKLPSSPDGAWSEGLRVKWEPGFQSPVYRSVVRKDGRAHFLKDDPVGRDGSSASGITDPDGKVMIFFPAMAWTIRSGDPGILASVIYHESVHFQDLVTRGWDTHEGLELRAIKATLKAADILFPERSQDGTIEIRRRMKAYLRADISRLQSAVDEQRTHPPFPDSDQEKLYAERFAAQESEEADYSRLAAAVKREDEDELDKAKVERRKTRWSQFQAWTMYSCEYILGPQEGDPAWGRPDRIRAREEFDRAYLRNHLVVLSKEEISDGLRRGDLYDIGSMGTCVSSVAHMIRDLPGPVDADWLMKKIEYERSGGKAGEVVNALLKAVQSAVAGGSAEIVKTAEAPFVADRRSPPPNHQDPGAGRIPGRPSGGPNTDTLPWNQLRGVSALGW